MTEREIYTIDLPWFILLEPPDGLFVFAMLEGVPVMVVTETRELADDAVRKHWHKPLPVQIALKRIEDFPELLKVLKEYMAIPEPSKALHIGLKCKSGRVGKLHIPTLIEQIEEMDRPGPTNSPN